MVDILGLADNTQTYNIHTQQQQQQQDNLIKVKVEQILSRVFPNNTKLIGLTRIKSDDQKCKHNTN